MKSVFDTIVAIRSTASKNEKLALLMAQKDNADLRQYLKMAYEPKINFYVTKVQPELASPLFGKPDREFNGDLIAEIYDTIAKRELTGNAARRWLAEIHQDTPEHWGKELLELMIQRDVKAGMSAGTINKVWPGLITDVPYMRCSLPKEADIENWPWHRGIYSQIKADGMFANVSHSATGLVTIESRNGSPFPMEYFDDLVEEVKARIPLGHQLHGELLIEFKGKILAREVGNGMFNKLLQGGELEPGYVPVYHVWDIIPIAEAKPKNKYNVAYSKRFDSLIAMMAPEQTKKRTISLIDYKIVYSLKEAYAHSKDAMMAGLEGTVIKHPDMIWEDTTSKYQVKLKLEFVCELLVVGTNAADSKSKNAALFGSLQCESSCGKLRVGVTGLKDDKRKEIAENLERYVNKMIISVKANGIMAPNADTGGFFSLFLPRFSDERLDKTVADSLEQIQMIQQNAIEMGNIVK